MTIYHNRTYVSRWIKKHPYDKLHFMKMIFIRHAEPDYINDALTEKGDREARALSKRIAKWHVTKAYLSPQGRAIQTASYSLKALGIEAETLPFLHEFSSRVTDPVTQREGIAWDFIASDWTKYDCMFGLEDSFMGYPCIKESTEMPVKYKAVIDGIDNILKEYGYVREGRFYRNLNAKERFLRSTVSDDHKIVNNSPYEDPNDEPVLLFFCHLGVTLLIMSHLMNLPFESLTHGIFLPSSSITVLSTEERWSNEAYFRAQVIGDCRHLYDAGEPISPAGSFAEPFQD